MEKINIAELLKDCPSGMELDCSIHTRPVIFNCVKMESDYPIRISSKDGFSHSLTYWGSIYNCEDAKCVIFPKGKTTWEGFVPPCKFKDGDIVVVENDCGIHTFIYNYTTTEYGGCGYYVIFTSRGNFKINGFCGGSTYRRATEEEKQRLFDAIKANGYNWNAETKTLEKITRPNFKVGDWVTDGVSKCQIYLIDGTRYWYSENCILGSIESVDKRHHLWTINDAKDGDVLFHSDSASKGIFIFKEIVQRGTSQKVICHCDYDSEDGFCLGENHTCCWTDSKILHPATKEQRDLLFQKIKEAGYKWNSETKTLEKLIQPIFKAGNKVRNKNNHNIVFTITSLEEDSYGCGAKAAFWFDDQDDYELVPNKFDITTLKPFDKVLVRDSDKDMWCASIFSHTWKDKYFCIDTWHNQCIPYEANKKLLGTTNNPAEYGSE